MLDIEWIQNRIRRSEYYFSRHGDQLRQNSKVRMKGVNAMKVCYFCGNKNFKNAKVQYTEVSPFFQQFLDQIIYF